MVPGAASFLSFDLGWSLSIVAVTNPPPWSEGVNGEPLGLPNPYSYGGGLRRWASYCFDAFGDRNVVCSTDYPHADSKSYMRRNRSSSCPSPKGLRER